MLKLKRSISVLAAGSALIGSLAFAGTALAAPAPARSGLNGNGGYMMHARFAPATAPLAIGDGQPVIGGTVTAVDGTSLTVANKSVTYAVSVASATVSKRGVADTAQTLSDVAVGDTVVVQGTVNGTSVTASSITVHGAMPGMASSTPAQRGGGMMNAVGGFFARFFGFF